MKKIIAENTIFKIRLLRNILIVSLSIVTLLSLYNIFFIYPSFTELLIESTKEDAVRTTRHLASVLIEEQTELKIAQMELYPKCCFNHVVGLPTVKFDDEGIESEPLPLMGFSKRMLDAYQKHLKYSQCKCRGSASSEVISVRWLVFKYAFMNVIPHHKAVILPGTSSKLADEFSIRIKEIIDSYFMLNISC